MTASKKGRKWVFVALPAVVVLLVGGGILAWKAALTIPR